MSTSPTPITINETTTREHPEALTDSALGCAFLEAADGPGSLTFFTPRYFSVSLNQPLSAAELRHLAIKHFIRAADAFQSTPTAFPGEAWVMFQIGWYSFAYEDGPRDLQLARTALERVLEIDPDNAPTHLALAWLLYQEQQREKSSDSFETTPTWDGVIGQHLRSALCPRLHSPLAQDVEIGREKEGDLFSRTTLPYIVIESGHSLMLQALDDLDPIVPDSHRFAYAVAHYHVATGAELELSWLEEALRWPQSDDYALCEIHVRVARSMIFDRRDLSRGYRHFVKAHDHLVRLAEHEKHDPWAAFPLVETYFNFEYLPEDIDLLQNARPAFLEFVDACMDLFERGLLTEWLGLDTAGLDTAAYTLGELTAIAGWLLLKARKILEATKYLARAREFEQDLSDDVNWSPDAYRDPHWRALHWRMLLAKGWRHICLLNEDFAEAYAQNERVLNWLPDDPEALDLKLKLAPTLLLAHHHNQSSQELAHIRAGTEFLVQQAVAALEPSANDRLQKLLSMNADDPHGMDRILDQLNNLVQQGSRIQPAALRSASDKVISELGNEVFSELHPDSRHFLTTAEVFYAASENVATEMDASPIAIEYAKVVETELHHRFLPALVRGLAASNWRMLQAGKEIWFDDYGSWRRKLSNLLLGQSVELLQHAINGTGNEAVRKIIETLQPNTDWSRRLAEDLQQVVDRYRNGAAHIEPVARDAVTEFRDLLFVGGLLQRLVELGKLGDRIPSVESPRRGSRA